MASRTIELSSCVGEFREGEKDENPLPPILLAGPQGQLPNEGGERLFTLVSFFFFQMYGFFFHPWLCGPLSLIFPPLPAPYLLVSATLMMTLYTQSR